MIYKVLSVLALCGLSFGQNQWATNWVEMLPENHTVEGLDSDGARSLFRAALPSHNPALGQLVQARVQILANYGTTQQFGLTTPFRYSVEQLGNTPLAGYQGTYGSVTCVAVGGQIVGGIGAWLGMCGGASLTGFDGQCDGQGPSGHTAGNQVGEWSQESIYTWPSIPSVYYAGLDGSGLVPVAVLLTAQGFITDWQSNGHYFRRWQTRTSIDGERALSLKVRIVYETL
jgi:hypothetical protein